MIEKWFEIVAQIEDKKLIVDITDSLEKAENLSEDLKNKGINIIIREFNN